MSGLDVPNARQPQTEGVPQSAGSVAAHANEQAVECSNGADALKELVPAMAPGTRELVENLPPQTLDVITALRQGRRLDGEASFDRPGRYVFRRRVAPISRAHDGRKHRHYLLSTRV